MSLNIIDCVQGDATWFANRLGCVTSSRVAAVVSKRKRGEGELEVRSSLRWELIGEILTQKPTEHYVSRWMAEGKEREPLARAEYEMRMDIGVDLVGYVYHPTIKMAGASPDGLIGNKGFVEFKCPTLRTHLEYLALDVIPEQYLPQLCWQLAMDPEREWNDFVSFHPDLPERYQMFRKRLNRNKELDAVIRGMELEVEQFNESVQKVIEEMASRATEIAGVAS